MKMQQSFPEFDLPSQSPPRDQLFFAILPPVVAAKIIANIADRLRSENGLAGGLLLTCRFHITMCSLGCHAQIPLRWVADLEKEVSAVSMAPFKVSFDRALSFAGKSRTQAEPAFVLRSSQDLPGIRTLREKLAVAAEISRPHYVSKTRVKASSGFTPHVTLLYDRKRIEERSIEPVAWMVREFVLVYSPPGQSYQFLGRWPLRPPPHAATIPAA